MEKLKKTACGAIFVCSNTERVLLNLRAPYKTHGLTWCLWGGMVEAGETPFECLVREITEEVGYLPEIEKTNPFDVYESKDGHFRYYSYICVVDEEFIPNINKEAVGYTWCKLGIWPKPMHQGAQITLCNDTSIKKIHSILENHRKSKVS